MSQAVLVKAGGTKKDNAYFVNWRSGSGFGSVVKVGKTVGGVAGCGGDGKFSVTINSWNGNVASISLGYGEGASTAWIRTTKSVNFDFSQKIGTNMIGWYNIVATVLGYAHYDD